MFYGAICVLPLLKYIDRILFFIIFIFYYLSLFLKTVKFLIAIFRKAQMLNFYGHLCVANKWNCLCFILDVTGSCLVMKLHLSTVYWEIKSAWETTWKLQSYPEREFWKQHKYNKITVEELLIQVCRMVS